MHTYPSYSEFIKTLTNYRNIQSYLLRIKSNRKISRLTKSQIQAINLRIEKILKKLRKLALNSCFLTSSLLISDNPLIAQCTDNSVIAPFYAPTLGGLNLPGVWASISIGDVDDDGIDDFIGKGSEFIQYYKGLPSGSFQLQMNPNPTPFFPLRLEQLDDILLFNLKITSNEPELIVGRMDGTIELYEIGSGDNYQPVTINPFDGIDVGSQASPSIGNFDNDFDKDAFIGNLDGEILYFERDNSGNFVPRNGFANPFNGIDVGTRARPFMIDNNDDGIIDAAVVGNSDGILKYFTLNSNGTQFIEQTGLLNPFSGIDVGIDSNPILTDLQNDGDLDLLVGNREGNVTSYLLTTGYTSTSNPPDILHEAELGYLQYSDPEFFDWDDDGDEDLFVGLADGTVKYFENINNNFVRNDGENPFSIRDFGGYASIEFAEIFDRASGVGFTEILIGAEDGRLEIGFISRAFNGKKFIPGTSFINVAAGSHSSPAAVDFDNDGDNDIFIGNQEGRIIYFENTETNLVQRFGSENPFDGIDVGSYAAPVFLDMDGDPFQDVFIGHSAGIKYFESTPANFIERPAINPFSNLRTSRAKPTIANLIRSGRLDIVVGNNSGHFNYYSNFGGSDCFNPPCSMQNSYIGPDNDWNTTSIYWSLNKIPISCSRVNIPTGKEVTVGLSESAECATIKIQPGAIFEVNGTLTSQP